MDKPKETRAFIPPYEGSDMIGYVLNPVLKLYPEHQKIQSITNIRDFAIVVTDLFIYRIRPDYGGGWCVEKVGVI